MYGELRLLLVIERSRERQNTLAVAALQNFVEALLARFMIVPPMNLGMCRAGQQITDFFFSDERSCPLQQCRIVHGQIHG